MLNEIQRIARENGQHFVVVVQISRKVEERADKRPTLADLKDSGGFEEVADLILFFYRDAYYVSKNVEDDFEFDVIEINIAKQRQGKTGIVKAMFSGPTTKIKKLNPEDEALFQNRLKELNDRKPEKQRKRR